LCYLPFDLFLQGHLQGAPADVEQQPAVEQVPLVVGQQFPPATLEADEHPATVVQQPEEPVVHPVVEMPVPPAASEANEHPATVEQQQQPPVEQVPHVVGQQFPPATLEADERPATVEQQPEEAVVRPVVEMPVPPATVAANEAATVEQQQQPPVEQVPPVVRPVATLDTDEDSDDTGIYVESLSDREDPLWALPQTGATDQAPVEPTTPIREHPAPSAANPAPVEEEWYSQGAIPEAEPDTDVGLGPVELIGSGRTGGGLGVRVCGQSRIGSCAQLAFALDAHPRRSKVCLQCIHPSQTGEMWGVLLPGKPRWAVPKDSELYDVRRPTEQAKLLWLVREAGTGADANCELRVLPALGRKGTPRLFLCLTRTVELDGELLLHPHTPLRQPPAPRKGGPASQEPLVSSCSVDEIGRMFLQHPYVAAAARAGHEAAGLLIGRRATDGRMVLGRVHVLTDSNVGSKYSCTLNPGILADGEELVGWVHLHPNHYCYLSLIDIGSTQVCVICLLHCSPSTIRHHWQSLSPPTPPVQCGRRWGSASHGGAGSSTSRRTWPSSRDPPSTGTWRGCSSGPRT
jgi:proteasome lid subunit RPN8/RPN11